MASRQGRAVIDFGAFPGKGEASVTVVGIADITLDALVEAWIVPEATVDHSVDEHLVDPPRVIAGAIVAGVGFTIYGYRRENPRARDPIGGAGTATPAPCGHPYGKFSVGWVLNK